MKRGEIELVAIDLDGTLLTSSREIHPESAAAVKEAVAAGVRVVLASGRMASGVQAFGEALGLAGPHIACNGAFVFGPDGSEWFHRPLTARVRDAVDRFAAERGLQLNAYSRYDVFELRTSPWGELYRSRIRLSAPRPVEDGLRNRLEPTKMMIVADPAEVPALRIQLEEVVRPLGAEITVSEPEYLEVLPAGVDKGLGLFKVAERLHIDREKVAAIGDYANDLEMLRWAGFSGAPANASEDVRKVVDVVVRSNDEGAVADFLRRIV